MNGIGLVLLAAVVSQTPSAPSGGTSYGWTVEGNKLTYILQLSPELVEQSRVRPLPITSDLPKELEGLVSRIMVVVGKNELPRDPPLEKLNQLFPRFRPDSSNEKPLVPANSSLSDARFKDVEPELYPVAGTNPPLLGAETPPLRSGANASLVDDNTNIGTSVLGKLSDAVKAPSELLAQTDSSSRFLSDARTPNAPNASNLPSTSAASSSALQSRFGDNKSTVGAQPPLANPPSLNTLSPNTLRDNPLQPSGATAPYIDRTRGNYPTIPTAAQSTAQVPAANSNSGSNYNYPSNSTNGNFAQPSSAQTQPSTMNSQIGVSSVAQTSPYNGMQAIPSSPTATFAAPNIPRLASAQGNPGYTYPPNSANSQAPPTPYYPPNANPNPNIFHEQAMAAQQHLYGQTPSSYLNQVANPPTSNASLPAGYSQQNYSTLPPPNNVEQTNPLLRTASNSQTGFNQASNPGDSTSDLSLKRSSIDDAQTLANTAQEDKRKIDDGILRVFFLLSLVMNFYLGVLIRKLRTRYRTLLTSVRVQGA